MDILQIFTDFLREQIVARHEIFQSDDNFVPAVEFPKNSEYGDFTTNAAMVLCKQAKCAPKDLAAHLVEILKTHPQVTEVDIAGAGFVNWRVKNELWHELLLHIREQNQQFGCGDEGRGQKINVEYISANPTGPLHVGHVRGAVFGDVLANLLQNLGYEVTREYYLNDAGRQIEILIESLYWRYQQLCGLDVPQPAEELYIGDYIIDIAEKLKQKDGTHWLDCEKTDYFSPLREFALDIIIRNIKEDLRGLGIEMDYYNSEQSLIEARKTDEMLADLQSQDLLYRDVLPKPKGKSVENWEQRPQLLFRSTRFGDDSDRPLQKSDSSYTYFANDIAGHHSKYQRGFLQMIDIMGADHSGYVKRIQAAVRAISNDKAALTVCLMQIVRLVDKGEIVKMSKRSGNFVTLRELIERVGRDAVRFTMLTRDNNAQMDFDFDTVTAQNSDNPVFYVQYAYARLCSLQRLIAEQFPDGDFAQMPPETMREAVGLLTEPRELALIKKCAEFPGLLRRAARKSQPHLLSYYLYELAESFHKFWSAGNRDPKMRFVLENHDELTRARFLLAQVLRMILQKGLTIMGVSAPESL